RGESLQERGESLHGESSLLVSSAFGDGIGDAEDHGDRARLIWCGVGGEGGGGAGPNEGRGIGGGGGEEEGQGWVGWRAAVGEGVQVVSIREARLENECRRPWVHTNVELDLERKP